jgi:hypothetical protein
MEEVYEKDDVETAAIFLRRIGGIEEMKTGEGLQSG